MFRSQIVPDRLYYVIENSQYFVSPDGCGGYWFDNMDEVNDAYGEGNFDLTYSIARLSEF